MITIAGASGQLGHLVIDALLKTVPAQQIVALARDTAKAADLAARSVQVRAADYDRLETLGPALAGSEQLLLISASEVGKRAPQHRAVIAAAKADADYRKRVANAFNSAATAVGTGASSTEVRLHGPGGGGVPYANFLQAVKSRYVRAWSVPDGVTDDSATAVADVTIARDGTVIEARIVKPSGNAAVDRSVRSVLDRVTWAAPLPDSASENQRTVTIHFNVRAKRGLG